MSPLIDPFAVVWFGLTVLTMLTCGIAALARAWREHV